MAMLLEVCVDSLASARAAAIANGTQELPDFIAHKEKTAARRQPFLYAVFTS